jgi:osmoprotectant transport system ATP-binding protein
LCIYPNIVLKLNNISKRFNKDQALYPFSYEACAGQTSVFIGPSGCGKSTLLRLIAGLLKSDTGEILIDGLALSEETLYQFRQRMGYVIQEGGLFPHLRAKANVTIMAEFLCWDKNRIDARVDDLSNLVQLPTELLSRYPGELSGGQRQRVSLMRALMLDPELLLLDEPLGALDPMIRFDLQQDLKEIFSQLGKTVLLISHDISEAAFFSDTLILLREGKIVQQGTIEDLVQHPAEAFVEQFIRAQRYSFTAIDGAGP